MAARDQRAWVQMGLLGTLASSAHASGPPGDLGPPAPAAQLAGARGTGGTAQATITTTMGATVGGNSASGLTTGNNVIQAGSFANASSLPVVIQNSGANVLIQNATVIHLELK